MGINSYYKSQYHSDIYFLNKYQLFFFLSINTMVFLTKMVEVKEELYLFIENQDMGSW